MRKSLTLVIALLVLVALLLACGAYAYRLYKENGRLTSNLSQTVVQYRDAQGRYAVQARMVEATRKELMRANKGADSLKSAYAKQLAEAYREVKSLRLRPADVQYVTKTAYLSRDSGLVSMDSVVTLPFRLQRNHYSFDLYRKGDSLLHRHTYQCNLTVVISKERYFKSGQRIQHPRWYFWKRWVPVWTTASDDTSGRASIRVAVKLCE